MKYDCTENVCRRVALLLYKVIFSVVEMMIGNILMSIK